MPPYLHRVGKSGRIRRAGFSLPEVTMATAIVAAVALPQLAMLAGSASTQGAARDRGTSARIAREVTASIVPSPPGRFALHLRPGDPIPLPVPDEGATTCHLIFDDAGRFLEETDAGMWSRGTRGEGSGTHLVQVRILPADAAPPAAPRLCELELTVATPASAPAAARSADRYLSRLLSP